MKFKKIRRLSVILTAVFCFGILGYMFYQESDFKADALVTDVPMNESFDSAGKNLALTPKDKKTAKPDVAVNADQDAIKGGSTLVVKDQTYSKPKIDYFKSPLVGLAKNGTYDVYLAVKGKIDGDNALLKIEWKNKVFYPRPINSASSIQRLIKKDEIDENNWTIIHFNFTLPSYVNRNDVNISFGCYNGMKFSGYVDSLSVVNTETNNNTDQLSTLGNPLSTTALPLSTLADKPLQSLLISGKAKSLATSSMIRIILTDDKDKDYQVYGTNGKIDTGSFDFKLGAEETKILLNTKPKELKIISQDMDWEIDSIRLITKDENLDPTVKEDLVKLENAGANTAVAKSSLSTIEKNVSDTEKIEKLNQWAKDRKLDNLKLGDTNISTLPYDQKKAFLNTIPANMDGIEYYQSGVFEIVDDQHPDDAAYQEEEAKKDDNAVILDENGNIIDKTAEPTSYLGIEKTYAGLVSKVIRKIVPLPVKNVVDLILEEPGGPNEWTSVIPASFDWRNQHGKNWVTSVDLMGQGSCGSCWAWASAAAVESGIKLKYNDPSIDIVLSKQIAMCSLNLPSGGHGGCGGGFPRHVFEALKNHSEYAIPPEELKPYNKDNDADCTMPAGAREKSWKISDYGRIGNRPSHHELIGAYDEDIKANLILHGPYTMCNGTHCMLLVGYYYDSQNRMVWILKNSWGLLNYDGELRTGQTSDGYAHIIIPYSVRSGMIYPGNPYPIDQTFDAEHPIKCNDEDGDGYYTWGTLATPKPVSCPPNIPAIQDCNDSDPALTTSCPATEPIMYFAPTLPLLPPYTPIPFEPIPLPGKDVKPGESETPKPTPADGGGDEVALTPAQVQAVNAVAQVIEKSKKEKTKEEIMKEIMRAR